MTETLREPRTAAGQSLLGAKTHIVMDAGWYERRTAIVAIEDEAALVHSESPSPEGLTEAWAETEAALPEGWLLVQLERTYRLSKTKPRRLVEGYWMARAHPAETPESEFGLGDTPAAALLALAARLRSSADSGTEGT